jgi:hypothetical protein
VFVAVITRLNFIPQVSVDQGLIPPIKDYKDLLDWARSFGLVAFAAGALAFFLSWAFEMHNIASKALQIRHFWDKYFIVKPLSQIASSQVPINRETIRKVMSQFYYEATKKIDQHYVEVFWRYALVFWILFEHLIVVTIAIVILELFKTPHLWELIVYLLILAVATAVQFFLVTVRKTADQVRQIPAEDVRTFFRAMTRIARI